MGARERQNHEREMRRKFCRWDLFWLCTCVDLQTRMHSKYDTPYYTSLLAQATGWNVGQLPSADKQLSWGTQNNTRRATAKSHDLSWTGATIGIPHTES